VSDAVRRPRRSESASVDATVIRRRLREALEGCAPRERALLALLLIERLTPTEAAHTMRLPLPTVTRRYRALLAELTRAYHGLSSRRAARAASELLRLRRAS
jgi:DNA-directed RNA polymerase specialized sigma24 family protein